jgi:hypothetical protein
MDQKIHPQTGCFWGVNRKLVLAHLGKWALQTNIARIQSYLTRKNLKIDDSMRMSFNLPTWQPGKLLSQPTKMTIILCASRLHVELILKDHMQCPRKMNPFKLLRSLLRNSLEITQTPTSCLKNRQTIDYNFYANREN